MVEATFTRTPRASPRPNDGPTRRAPVSEALALLLANEPEAALRWAAAALERDPSAPLALTVTSRALARMGRTRAAIDGLVFAVERAIVGRNALLALVAVDDLRALGAGVAGHLDRIAAAFCESTSRPRFAEPGARAQGEELDPLSAILRGPALASRATQIVYEAVGVEWPTPAAVPLFGALSEGGLRELVEVFDVVTVPAGHRLVEEGQSGDAGYFIASGEVQISRQRARGDAPVVVSRLGSGGFFGEMALLCQLPASSDVVTTRPSILLVGRRDGLERVAAFHPDVGAELAAHCRRSAVGNLGRSSPVVSAVPAPERAALVERLELRLFERGAKLVSDGQDAPGLHLVVAGEAAVVARDGAERVVLETLLPGATVGEVELVLCRDASADVIAVRDTAALFLPREEFFTLAADHPSIVHGLYAIAVRRHLATKNALEAGSVAVGDECIFPEPEVVAPATTASPRARTYESAPPPALPPRVPAPVTRERVLSARAIVDPVPVVTSVPRERASLPPSLAPTAASTPSPRPTPPASGRLARLSLQGAAAVAVAASVAALYATREREPREVTANARAPEPAPSSVPPAARMGASAAPSAAAPARAAPSIEPPSASATKAFLTRELTKPRPRTPVRAVPSASASAARAMASAAPDAPSTAQPLEAQRAASTGEEEFGGRE